MSEDIDIVVGKLKRKELEAKPKRKPWEIKPIRNNYNINLFG